jgi:hypothetical protein
MRAETFTPSLMAIRTTSHASSRDAFGLGLVRARIAVRRNAGSKSRRCPSGRPQTQEASYMPSAAGAEGEETGSPQRRGWGSYEG